MRKPDEVSRRLAQVEQALLYAVARREGFAVPDAEHDLFILSLLDQWETLIWVLDEEEQAVVH